MHAGEQQDALHDGQSQLLGIEAATGLLLSTAWAAAGLKAAEAGQAFQQLCRLLPLAGAFSDMNALLDLGYCIHKTSIQVHVSQMRTACAMWGCQSYQGSSRLPA